MKPAQTLAISITVVYVANGAAVVRSAPFAPAVLAREPRSIEDAAIDGLPLQDDIIGLDPGEPERVGGETSTPSSRLVRRKGGGGGASGHGGGHAAGKGGTGKGSSSEAKPSSVSTPNLVGGRSKATAYGKGGGPVTTIAEGQAFAGRSEGGGSRSVIFGTSVYGSGYPGVEPGHQGVAGLGFPFYYYPVVWPPSPHQLPYLTSGGEYGTPNDAIRPGGPLMETLFVSNVTNTTFRAISDNSTVQWIAQAVAANCSDSNLVNMTSASLGTSARDFVVPFVGGRNGSGAGVPEQAVQYYRASSVVLTLDGYNNTAVFGANGNASATPLPADTDGVLLECLNMTIALGVPLVDAPGSHHLRGASLAAAIVCPLLFVVVSGILCLDFALAERKSHKQHKLEQLSLQHRSLFRGLF